MYFRLTHNYLLFVLFLAACSKENKSVKSENYNFSFVALDSSKTNIKFINKVNDQEEFNINTYRNFYNGGGVAVGDINNDGLLDIYFTSNMGENKLYLNKGSLSFEDITANANVEGNRAWHTGVTMADVNGDGWLDIYVCNSGDVQQKERGNELFINNGDLTFTESADKYGLQDFGLSTHAVFFDFDLDGDLDCYVLNNSYKDPDRIALYGKDRSDYGKPGGDRLYENKNNVFVDITKEAGIYSSDIGFGLGVSVADFNNDNYPDIYVSNDFWERDYLYFNQKNKTYKEVLIENLSYTSAASMGSDAGDINNDGEVDVFTTDMLPSSNLRLKGSLKFDDYYLTDLKTRNSFYYQFVQNCLHVNNGEGKFVETAFYSNLAATDWSWGALMFDMNLDGNKDIFVSNGVYHDITDNDFIDFIGNSDAVKNIVLSKGKYDFRDFLKYLPNNPQVNYAFLNEGNLKFNNIAKDIGLGQLTYSNGAAYGDLDNDGDFDLVVNNVNMPAGLYANNAAEKSGNNYIKLKFEGNTANKFGIGTKIELFQQPTKQVYHVMSGKGFQSSVDHDLIIGLGKNAGIDSLIVIWPDNKKQTIKSIKINSTTLIKQEDAKEKFEVRLLSNEALFTENAKTVFNPIPDHKENIYDDYNHDRLLPHMLSTQGPKIAKGDVNNDGIEDFIILGAIGHTNSLYISQKGKWVLSKQVDFSVNEKTEGTCVAFFDADNDKDLDLLIGMGGNEYESGYDAFQSQFFLNDGKGNFRREVLSGPFIIGQVSCIKPFDYDKDGDVDLFIGGRSIPGLYGVTPRCFLLNNQGNNKWKDVTDDVTGPLGMVTDAAWGDINQDRALDLIVVGEWMPVTVLSYAAGKFTKALEIPNSEGWWNCVALKDINNDNIPELIAGNWGLNTRFKASVNKPMRMFVNDFDDNKKPDPLIEWYYQEENRSFPMASKIDMVGRFPFLKKKALKYKDYAGMSLQDLFPKEKINSSLKYNVSSFASTIFFFNKNNVTSVELPVEAQLSPIMCLEIADIDKDGIVDILFGGNMYRMKPEFGMLDGFKGGYLKGKGNGKFEYINPKVSGIHLSGEVRDVLVINENILYAINDRPVQSFKFKK